MCTPDLSFMVGNASREHEFLECTAILFKFFNCSNNFLRQSVFLKNISTSIGECERERSYLNEFLGNMRCNISRARDERSRTLYYFSCMSEHRFNEIHRTISGRLGTNMRTPVANSFPRKCTVSAICDTLVCTVEITDFTTTHTDVPCGDIGAWSNILRELSHKCDTKSAHLRTTLSFWIKVTSAFATTKRKPRKRIFKYLFKTKKREHVRCH